MVEITFVQPQYLWLLFLIPFLILTHFYGLRQGQKKAIRFANFEALSRISGGYKLSLNLPLLFIRFCTLLFLILALSGPIFWYRGQAGDFSYALAIDVSGSMLADDFTPNRLSAAKKAGLSFIDHVPLTSRIAILTFSGTQFFLQTLTEDKEDAAAAMDKVKIEHASGTAVGDAIIAASNVLMEEKERGRVIILLSDGQSNTGTVLEDAINYANDQFVTVNTIGMGTEEGGKVADTQAISTLDTDSLGIIAAATGGKFYRATTPDELTAAYNEIAKTSTKKIPVRLSLWLIMLTFIALSLEWIIVNTRFRSVP